MEPIFIVGCGRTGSRMYKQILSNHPDIHISGEIHIRNPWYRLLGTDNYSKLRSLKDIEPCFTGELNGNFWRYIRDNYDEERRKDVKERFLSSNRTTKDLIEILLRENSKINNATVFGSKFPLHFYHVPILKRWWPDCKIIHITRDPRAVLTSELKKGKKRKPNYPISQNQRLLYDTGIMLYVIVQWTWSAKCHRYYKKKWADSYELFRYEDLIMDPEGTVKELTDFVGIDFDEDLLEIKVIGSSFKDNKKFGFDKDRIHRWRNILSPGKTRLMNLLLSTQMKKMGYKKI